MKITVLYIPAALLFLPFSNYAQSWKWAQSLGAPDNGTSIKNIRPYTGTNVFVAGSFAAPTLALGGQILSNAGQDDGFVAISDDTGQYAWATRIGGSDRDFVVDAAAAAQGDFVVVGNFNSISLSVGGASLLNSGETDAFVVRYNQDKTQAWVRKIGTADIDEVSGVVLDTAGNAYVSGQVLNKLTLAPMHVFLRKYDAAGSLVWEKKGVMQGGGVLQATALTRDDNQDIYLGGSIYGAVSFEGINIINNEDYAAFIVKYDPSGLLLDTLVRPELSKFNGLQAHDNYVYGCAEKTNFHIGWGWPLSDSKIHVLKFDTELNSVWERSAGGDSLAYSLDIARSISVDSLGNAYITGYFFSDTLNFAGQALPNLFNIHYYYPQIFVFKYTASGEALWGKSLGGIHSDEGLGIHAFGDDQFYVGGNFESETVAFGAYELHNTGTLDSMYVHLRPSRFVRKTMGFLAVFDINTSGVNPEPEFQALTLFPNPATDHLSLRLRSPVHTPLVLQISSADGRLLRQCVYGEQTVEIREDLNGLAPGFYFVTLRTGYGMFSGKFVKE